MTARVHRHIQLDIPAVPLTTRSLLPAEDLHLELTTTRGQGVQPPGVSIGFGQNLPDNLDLYLGWAGGRGALSTAPVINQTCDPDSVFGAATAAVLGAARCFASPMANPCAPAGSTQSSSRRTTLLAPATPSHPASPTGPANSAPPRHLGLRRRRRRRAAQHQPLHAHDRRTRRMAHRRAERPALEQSRRDRVGRRRRGSSALVCADSVAHLTS
jgi:hypothetical protein